MTRFEALLTPEKLKELAKEPEIQFDLWIMRTFNVLPTDPRYQELTWEQKRLLWEDYLFRKALSENKTQDEEFDKKWEELQEETNSEDTDEEEAPDIAENFKSFVDRTGLQIEYEPEAKRLLNKDEWEEVD